MEHEGEGVCGADVSSLSFLMMLCALLNCSADFVYSTLQVKPNYECIDLKSLVCAAISINSWNRPHSLKRQTTFEPLKIWNKRCSSPFEMVFHESKVGTILT